MILFVALLQVRRFRYWQGNGLAIHTSQVRVPAGHHCGVCGFVCASVTKQYNLVPDKRVISLHGLESNREPDGNK